MDRKTSKCRQKQTVVNHTEASQSNLCIGWRFDIVWLSSIIVRRVPDGYLYVHLHPRIDAPWSRLKTPMIGWVRLAWRQPFALCLHSGLTLSPATVDAVITAQRKLAMAQAHVVSEHAAWVKIKTV
jgi:hypothetical protein